MALNLDVPSEVLKFWEGRGRKFASLEVAEARWDLHALLKVNLRAKGGSDR